MSEVTIAPPPEAVVPTAAPKVEVPPPRVDQPEAVQTPENITAKSVEDIRSGEINGLLLSKFKNVDKIDSEAKGANQWTERLKDFHIVGNKLRGLDDQPAALNGSLEHAMPISSNGSPCVKLENGAYRPASARDPDAIPLTHIMGKQGETITCRDNKGALHEMSIGTLTKAQALFTIEGIPASVGAGRTEHLPSMQEQEILVSYQQYLITGDVSHLNTIDRRALAEVAIQNGAGIKATSVESFIDRLDYLREEVAPPGEKLHEEQELNNKIKRQMKEQLKAQYQVADHAYFTPAEMGEIVQETVNTESFSRSKGKIRDYIRQLESHKQGATPEQLEQINHQIADLQTQAEELTALQQLNLAETTSKALGNMDGVTAQDLDIMIQDGNVKGFCQELLRKFAGNPEAEKKINKFMNVEGALGGTSVIFVLLILMMQELQGAGQGGH